MAQSQPQHKKVFLCYLDDNDAKLSTYCYLILKTEKTITFSSLRYPNQQVTLPWERIIKLKEDIEQMEANENGRTNQASD